MKYSDARGLEIPRAYTGAAGRCRDKLDALLYHKINDIGAFDIGQRDIHAEGFISQLPHQLYFALDIVEFT